MIESSGNSNKPERRKRRRNFPAERLKRTGVSIQITGTDTVIQGRTFLNDLTPDGVGIFLTTQLRRGEKISLVIQNDKNIFIKGEVAWCSQYLQDTKVISAEPFLFRCGVKFKFETAEEKIVVARYVEELAVTISKDAA